LVQKLEERFIPYVFQSNKGKIIFQVPEVDASFTSSDFYLDCEWYVTMSDGSPIDDTTAPVDLWPYWSFKNVKLQLGAGLQAIEISFPLG
jgi:hypothetical protein